MHSVYCIEAAPVVFFHEKSACDAALGSKIKRLKKMLLVTI
jgi:hypothetical protein